MKKYITGVLIGITLTALTAMVQTYQVKKSTAEVDQIQGLYIFAKAKPTTEYEHLGTMKGPTVGSHEFDDLILSILKKVKKEYPNAEGIIFDGSIKQTHNTTVSIIKFK